MSVFNYKTRKESLSHLYDLVYRLASVIKKLTFWEVNDIELGAERLRRRKIQPVLTTGQVAKGQWFDVDLVDEDEVVTQAIAGTGISVSPATGVGDVTITNAGVTDLTAGTGISLSGSTGSITITNAGVTSLIAGTLITLDPVGGTGDVTVNGTAELPATATLYQALTWNGSAWIADWIRWAA